MVCANAGEWATTFPARLSEVERVVEAAAAFVDERRIVVDSYGLRLALYEALVNAIVHGSGCVPSREVALAVRADGGALTISVEDQGEGFDWMSHMREVEVEPAATSGRGFQLIQAYGFSLGFNDKGNLVTLTLAAPSAGASSLETGREGSAEVPEVAGGGELADPQAPMRFSVLIIDDQISELFTLNTFLASSGYVVITAQNGAEGCESARSKRPSVILLELLLPDEDGFSVLRRLKADPATASIPVLIVTSAGDIDSKVRAFELGAVDYMLKPVNSAEVRARTTVHVKLNLAMNALIDNQARSLRQLRSAQRALLVAPESLPEARFAVRFEPLHEVGGDFYDVVAIAKGVTGYFVSDVAGHDLETSFVTAAVKALVAQNCIAIYTPAESMSLLNKILQNVLAEGRYLTAVYLVVNRRAREVTLVGMGHPPVIHQPVKGTPTLVEMPSDVLGIFPEALFPSCTLKVAQGDRFFLYTDGLLEGVAGQDELWAGSLDRLVELLPDRSLPLREAVDELRRSALGDEGRKPLDDVIVMGVEV